MDEELKEISAEEMMLTLQRFSKATEDIPEKFRHYHKYDDSLSRLIELSKKE